MNGPGRPPADAGNGSGDPDEPSDRDRRLPAIIASAAALVVWIAAPELPWAARLWTTFLVGVLPVLLIVQARMTAEAMDLPRTSIYASSAIGLWILAGATFVVAWASSIDRGMVGFLPLPIPAFLGWTAAAAAVGIAILFIARAFGVREAPIVAYLMPRTGRERIAFAGLSATAGVCEELVFRGFLIPALDLATGSIALATAVSSAVFGILHAYQRPTGALRAATLGAILAVPLLVTGSLLPSMAAHATIDLLAGLWLRDCLLR